MADQKKVIILEGPDGAGKTTLAKTIVARLSASGSGVSKAHCGAYPNVTDGLADIYAMAMAPALLGRAHVLMDRCWIAEPIYGRTARAGRNRISADDRERLEGYARSCGAVLVLCLPPYERCLEAYLSRKELEYLDDETQLRAVYDAYAAWTVVANPPFPAKVYDWTRSPRDPAGDVLELAGIGR